jgi:hypothetical protein
MGLNDAAAAPMADVFSAEFVPWNYTVRVAAVLRTTQLPLSAVVADNNDAAEFDARYARPRHDAAWWEKKMRGQDFSVEDDLDTGKFNRALWLGLVGPGIPFPTRTTGIDLSENRAQLLAQYHTGQKN